MCEKHRFHLEREWKGDGLLYAYFGVNPSTADAKIDDSTVKKWIGFTERNGGRGFLVGNVFSYRATNVRELSEPNINPVGDANCYHLTKIIQRADVLVPCWGNQTKVSPPLRSQFPLTINLLKSSGKPVKCFGKTKSGDPRHPLMLGYDTELIDFFD